MPTFRFNDSYGEWEEEADTQWEADIEAALTKVERIADHTGWNTATSDDLYDHYKQQTRDRIAAGACNRCGLQNTRGHMCISPEIASAEYDSYTGSYVTQQVPGNPGTKRVVYTQVGARQPDPVKREKKDSGSNWLVIAAILALVGVCMWAAFIY